MVEIWLKTKVMKCDHLFMYQPVQGREHEVEITFKALYPQLRELAGRMLGGERFNHTLQRTALVHEIFLRLFQGKRKLRDVPPEQFLALAAHQMRLLLIDYARKRLAKKRGGNFLRVPLFESTHSVLRDEDSMLVMEEALSRLGSVDARALRVVELKFFAGCTNDETAKLLGCSDGTVEAIWLHARLWLHRELTRANTAASSRSA